MKQRLGVLILVVSLTSILLTVSVYRLDSFQEPRNVYMVIGWYKEDLGWINDAAMRLADRVFVYAKDPQFSVEHLQIKLSSVMDKVNLIPLPNLGREGHSYLYHIITHYNELMADPEGVTVFLQGKPQDHHGSLSNSHFVDMVINEARRDLISVSMYNIHQRDAYEFREPRTEAVRNLENMSFGDWFVKHIGKPFPEVLMWGAGALFAVKNVSITTKPVSYYQHLLDQLKHTNNPEEGFFIERSWYYIFTP